LAPTRIRSPTSLQAVPVTAKVIRTAITTARIAAGPACVWNTRRAGAPFHRVSMIAKRTRTLIAPM